MKNNRADIIQALYKNIFFTLIKLNNNNKNNNINNLISLIQEKFLELCQTYSGINYMFPIDYIIELLEIINNKYIINNNNNNTLWLSQLLFQSSLNPLLILTGYTHLLDKIKRGESIDININQMFINIEYIIRKLMEQNNNNNNNNKSIISNNQVIRLINSIIQELKSSRDPTIAPLLQRFTQLQQSVRV